MRDRDNIPKAGRPSRILAKNLIPGDKFCLTGDKVGKVTKVDVLVRGNYARAVEFCVKVPSGKDFDKAMRPTERVWIVETPANRRIRRKFYRMGKNRPTFITV